MLQVYGGKGEQKHRQIQFGGSAQQVILLSLLYPFNVSEKSEALLSSKC
jgi:hypothetical protein